MADTELSQIDALGDKQQSALAAIRAGNTFPQAAEAAGVGRATIYRWVQSDPQFRAAYNAWQQEMAESARARLLKLTDRAVDVIERALGRKDEKVAVAILKNLGAMRPVKRQATEPSVLALRMQLREQRQQHQAASEMLKHVMSTFGRSPMKELETFGVYTGLGGQKLKGQLVAPADTAAQAEEPTPKAMAPVGASDAWGGDSNADPGRRNGGQRELSG